MTAPVPITEPGVSTEDQYAEWLAARIGQVTGSNIWKVLKRTKTGWSEYRRGYLVEVLAEKMTGQSSEHYMSSAMQWGIETEPQARAAYESRMGAIVETTGFVPHHRIPSTGCSPDGLVGDDGLVEIKCPETRTHIRYLIDAEIDEKYQLQMQWQMACCNRAWCDYVSYDPRLPLSCSLNIKRVNRDDAKIAEMERLVIEFLLEVKFSMDALESGHLESSDV